MNEPPFLTLGIPTYNRAAILRARLEQLLPYVGPDVGAFVIDNGSRDATPAVLADVCARSPYVRSFRNAANLGCDANYLRVLEMADGTWCWLLGDDEPIDPTVLPELVTRLRAETADTVHLVAAGHSLPPGAPTRFHDAASFARGFYNVAAYQHMSCNLYRTAAARKHLIDAYKVAGLLHAYTSVGFSLMHQGAGLRVYDLRALTLASTVESAPQRWTNVDAQLGAWMTLHRVTPRDDRHAMDRREADERARVLVACALFDLLGARAAGLREPHIEWMLRLFPLRFYPQIAPVVAARALGTLPAVSARLVVLGASWVWGASAHEHLEQHYGTGPGKMVDRIRDAIVRGNDARRDVARSDY